jgi:hypothetical protein
MTMKHILSILLAALCAATGYGQTIRALGYNSTNGQVVAATNVVWTNAFTFSSNTVAAQLRTNLSLGAPWLTNTNTTNFRTAIGAIASGGEPNFQSITITDEGDSISLVANAKATMRSLAGSTNTNEPYSGTVEFQDFSDNTVSIVVSNGIILNVTGP